MPIPNTQLETWSNLGAQTSSAAAYASVKAALANMRPAEIYLQGSYCTSTNIFGDSDVDVVVQLNDVFHKDLSSLQPEHQARHEILFPPSTYRWHNFRAEVLQNLTAHFDVAAIREGNNSIKVELGAGRMVADVVPALQFRQYVSYGPQQDNFTYYEGVQFFDRAGNAVVNYPQLHTQNGENKNSATRTNGSYKETVRICKNMRNAMVDRGLLGAGVAPSYFIECLLHNVPDELFVNDKATRISGILNYLWTLPSNGLLCQNCQTLLIGNSSTQWTHDAYVAFVMAAVSLWNNW